MLQNHGFSNNTQSVIKYFTLIMCLMYIFDKNASKIDALAKHMIAKDNDSEDDLIARSGMSKDNVVLPNVTFETVFHGTKQRYIIFLGML